MARRGKKELKISAAVAILGKHGVGMGFPGHIIHRTINKLLKIYGDDGWRFIEDNSFQLVTETILAEQDEQKEIAMPEDNLFGDDESDDDDWGIPAPQEDILGDDESDDDDWGIPAPQYFTEDREPSSNVPVLARASSADDGRREIAGSNPNKGESNNEGQAVPAEILPPPRPRREPCYGWIVEVIDKEEDETTQHSEKKELTATRVRKRKSGWDLDPSEWKRACSD